MKLSVVVPVHNKAQILGLSLPSFFNQTLPQDKYEMIVVDDGSTDETPTVLKRLQQRYHFQMVRLKGLGPAAARNQGVERAQNEIILFTQDDIVAEQKMFAQHLSFHQQNPAEKYALVGFITWHPDLKITPFMYWLEHGGPQFDYDRLTPGQVADHLAFYTPNLSVKKKFFEETGGFDENLGGATGVAIYEDTELGWRMQQAGMKLIYNPRAIAYHYHSKDLRQVTRTYSWGGRIYALLKQKHPTLTFSASESLKHRWTHLKTSFLPNEARFWLTRFIFNRVTIRPLEKLAEFLQDKINLPLLYKIVCGYYFNQGMGEKSKIENLKSKI